MDGPQLVHMVALVGAGAGVHKGEHTCYEEGALMVRDCERSGKDGAGLSVFPLAITEEQ